MSLNRRLRSFVRVDASGRIVPGSNILRKSKPKIGKWKEVEIDECCFPSESLTYDIADVELTNIEFTLSCDAAPVITFTTDSSSTDLTSLVAVLNDKVGFVGVFGQADGDVTLEVKKSIADDVCAEGTLTFTVTEA